MRVLLLAFAAIVSLMGVAFADDPAPPTFSANPVTEEFLRNLDSEQLRMLRLAIKGCPSAGKAMRSERDPCVRTSTDRAVAASGNADLVAFHNGMRETDRYDENRTWAAWHGFLPKK